MSNRQTKSGMDDSKEEASNEPRFLQPFRGIRNDLERRIPYYWSDFKDGVIGPKAFSKTISTTFYLYFSIILPAIAFGNLQEANTGGDINVAKVLVGQVVGGLVFSLLAGQPLVVVMTTAPLVLFTKIIIEVASNIGVPFLPFFALVGFWNSFFLIIYAVFNLSKLMKYSSRATEETFGNFISIALTVDALKHLVKEFQKYYVPAGHTEMKAASLPSPTGSAVSETMEQMVKVSDICCYGGKTQGSDLGNSTMDTIGEMCYPCQRDVPLLYLILMLGTVWLGVSLFNFIKTPYLSARKRELLSDYSLPVAVIVFSVIGSAAFNLVHLESFKFDGKIDIQIVPFGELFDGEKNAVGAIFLSMVLGLSLSILFFMDQNISAAMVNSPENHLKKGNAYHWDLVVVAVINTFTAMFGLPFMHAVLPHSPLHVQCLADKETRVSGGYATSVVTHVRETRLTTLLSNILIGITLTFLHIILKYIPKAVLDGLFLYMAVTALYGNQMFERVSLLVTEQSAYPPNHYIKRVPQSKMHRFTAFQVSFSAYLIIIPIIFFFTAVYALARASLIADKT